MNVIARLEYEPSYYDSTVYRFNHYTTRTPPLLIIEMHVDSTKWNSSRVLKSPGIYFLIDLFDRIKREFFQSVTKSVLLCGCTTWTPRKRLEKTIQRCCVLFQIYPESSTQTQQLYSHLPPISQTILLKNKMNKWTLSCFWLNVFASKIFLNFICILTSMYFSSLFEYNMYSKVWTTKFWKKSSCIKCTEFLEIVVYKFNLNFAFFSIFYKFVLTKN